jgi:hypothetical protein
MKPGVAFFSGAILGVAGAYLITNTSESCDNLKGGANSEKDLFQIAMSEPTLKNIKAVCKQYNQKYSCKDGVLYNKDKTVLFKCAVDTDSVCTIPNTVTTIGYHAFNNLSQLKTITIPANSNLESIGDEAFARTGIVTIFIPDFVTTIRDFVFDGCSSLKTITVSDKNKKFCSIDGVLFNKKQTELIRYPPEKSDTTYTIPSTVNKISGGAFDSCKMLTSIIIPDSVTTIGVSAFVGCTGLTSITFPVLVKKIDYTTFSGCTSLRSIKIMNPKIVINDNAFDDYDSLKNITAPLNVLKEYYSDFLDASQGTINFKDLDGKKYKPNDKGVLVPKNK